MKLKLKRLRDQVMVLTGTSSGIGLVTARTAARQGARLVLAARSGEELQRLADEINAQGGQAVPVVADVAREEDMRILAATAVERFGGFDSWVNNAGVTIFGRVEDVPLEDERRMFETNFWGMVHGSLAAVRHLRRHGGALINLGSVASDRALPLQGMYSATKHAVKGFTDALRMELEMEKAPVSVTLIKPTSIATPLPRHSKNFLPVEPTLPPPVYAPEAVAEAILHCAQTPVRDVIVGGGGKVISTGGSLAPRLMDKVMEWTMERQQETDQPAPVGRDGGLHHPTHDLAERMPYPRHVLERSLYTRARLHPALTGAALLGAGLALGGIWKALGGSGGNGG